MVDNRGSQGGLWSAEVKASDRFEVVCKLRGVAVVNVSEISAEVDGIAFGISFGVLGGPALRKLMDNSYELDSG